MTAFEQRFFDTADGARIGYQVAGSGAGMPLLLCNGLGGNYHAYQPLVDDLGDGYRFLVWDYRGLFTSQPPRRGLRARRVDADRLRVEAHARDGLELIAREGFERFPIIAWSMGVQVALELYRSLRHRVTGMILLNGISGQVYRTIFGRVPATERWLPPLLRALRRVWPVSQAVVKGTTSWSGFIDIAIGVGLIHPDIDREAATKVLRAFGTLDMHLYFTQLDALVDHDAADVLPQIACPTLVLTSDRDVFTPGFAGRQMANAIPDVEVRNFPRGSHYAPIEFARDINAEVQRFLRQRLRYAPGEPRGAH